jgi:protein-disulfide isomerase
MGVAAMFLLVRMWSGSPENTGPRRTPPDVEDITSRGLSIDIRDAARSGSETARVVLIEYSDFECPFCARHARETYEQIDREFVANRRIQYVFRNYPIERIHPSALPAAKAAVCANQQSRFMEMRSHLFANQQQLASINMGEIAVAIGLDGAAFTSCLTQAASSVLEDEKREASRLGVSSTPTFFIGRRLDDRAVQLITKIPGALDYSYFKRALDSALAQLR